MLMYLKKNSALLLSVLLLCGMNVRAEEPSESFVSKKTYSSLCEVVGIGLALYLVSDVIPNIVNYYADSDDEVDKQKVTFLNYFSIGVSAVIGAYCVAQLYVIGKDVYEYTYPTEEQKAIINAAVEKNKFFEARQNFIQCLLDNSRGEKNSSGIPTVCEKLASVFGMLAGGEALDEMISNFKACCND